MALEPADENERTSAFAWLMEDPEHRAIESPTNLDAILNLYAARELYPDATADQFSWTRLPAAIGRLTRILPFHLWTY